MQGSAIYSLTGSKRDEANSLSREELDMVMLRQIMAFISMDNVVDPSHKHAPHQRQMTRVRYSTTKGVRFVGKHSWPYMG